MEHPEFASMLARLTRAFNATAGNAKWMKEANMRQQYDIDGQKYAVGRLRGACKTFKDVN